MKIFLVILAISITSFYQSLIAAEPERVIFSENFSGNTSPGVNTENNRSFMRGCKLDMNNAFIGSRQWGDIEIRCSIRFPKQPPRHFEVQTKLGGWREKNKYSHYSISLIADGLSLYALGLENGVQDTKRIFKFKDSGFEGFKPDVWYRFVIRCEKDRLKISVGTEGGEMKQICDAEVFPGGGGACIFSYDRYQKINENPFDIANVVVVELSTAPKTQVK
jgi:hypothetical protein